MKNIQRLFLGVVSSLLLAAGFARAADRLDPLTDHPAAHDSRWRFSSADPCTQACNSEDIF